MIVQNDDSDRLITSVQRSLTKSERVAIRGHGSKTFLTGEISGHVLQTTDHTGILSYEPDELVITVRAGTAISEVRNELAKHGQMLPFDPPTYNDKGTIGGAIAVGLAGPARPWYGSVQDHVLGLEMVNGLGQRLNFGGQVMKNVAGFDLSRLMVGSCGGFGLILSVSFKVLPIPKTRVTFKSSCSDVADIYREMLQKSNLIRSTLYVDGVLYALVIDSGSMDETLPVAASPISELDNSFWESVRDHKFGFFKSANQLWRILLPRGKQVPSPMRENCLEEWHGTQVWYRGDRIPENLPSGSTITDFRNPPKGSKLSKTMERLREAFDPKGVFASHTFV